MTAVIATFFISVPCVLALVAGQIGAAHGISPEGFRVALISSTMLTLMTRRSTDPLVKPLAIGATLMFIAILVSR